jgi:membrane protease YdiL (CAAX protease family)
VLPDSDPLPPDPPEPPATPSPAVHRIVALIEVLLCSDYPTQIAIGATLAAFGLSAYSPPGRLNVAYVVSLSIADSVALMGLVLLFLYAHGERPRDVLIGRGRTIQEIAIGIPLIVAALGIGILVLFAVQRFAPSLHTVENNPLQDLMKSPRDAWLFAFVLLVAGGIREEVQRAFLIHRFEVWLGGGVTGVIVTSAAFGAGHLLQGVDAMLATGLLGAFWGAIYLRRRSCVAPMVSHAGFDLLQIVQFIVVRR